MMCDSKRLFLVALVSVLLLYFCSQSQASSFDCCLGYTRHVLSIKYIRNFTEQLASEICDINAIIFHTHKRLSVCADPKKPWVKKIMRFLSQKDKK
ncbi:PREDICTED: C-C motif chemokine 20 isoform X2 [Chinchilla lanigera]|uniref:C-C motif chemokine 20 isoform X2 n=1 Tax=Chinchilla lanigera TaxID=34839 RepID=UPI0006980859|nr:PREDICTED: C-C motif chemokine 20 isoform X2 [Chinchilla lanigera]